MGKDGWTYQTKGDEHQADNSSMKEVKEIVELVIDNGYVSQGAWCTRVWDGTKM